MKRKKSWQRVVFTGGLLLAVTVCSTPLAVATEAASFAHELVGATPMFDNIDLCSSCSDYGSASSDNDLLFGVFAHSQPGFDRFISPMTNPVFFEDPRTLTEARAIFLDHNVPTAAGGGDIQLFALQLRAALTDRLSIVASKDGYAFSSNALIDDGWADLAAGLKYNLYSNVQDQQLLSAGFHYEIPLGSPSALQGNGDGEFLLYLTGGTEIFDYGHWISASGFRLPSDPSAESSMWYWSNHFDYEIADGFYLLTEMNWYHWMGAGNNPGLHTVEGGDLFNFGSTGVAGNDIVTNAVGVKLKRSKNRELGIAYEYPLTDRRDVLQSRLTVDWIFRY